MKNVTTKRIVAVAIALIVTLSCFTLCAFAEDVTADAPAESTVSTVLKGIFSGAGSVAIGFIAGERINEPLIILAVLCVGFVAYGLSIFFYVYAQRVLGAARTSAYYAIAPFIGALLSLIIFTEIPEYTYIIALGLMAIGAWLCASDEPIFKKRKNK